MSKFNLVVLVLTLLLRYPILTSSKVYYIKPSLNDSCPTEPCLTLSQFAVHSDEYLESHTLLTFLPGVHSLEGKLFVNNTNTFALRILDQFTTATIECKLPRNFSLEFHNVSTVDVHGLDFNDCANMVSSVDQLMIVDSIFSFNHTKQQTALGLVETTANITRSSFTNSVDGSIRQIVSEEVCKVGGAIVAIKSTVTIAESIFNRLSAQKGGAIYAGQGSNITITNSTFLENSVTGCDYLLTGFGGVLFADGCNVVICCSTFIGNSAVSDIDGAVSYGGVLSLYESTASIYQSTFMHNRATVGGIIGLWKSNMTSGDNIFHQNNANVGGILYGIKANVTDRGGIFTENDAMYEGGGVVFLCIGTVTFVTSRLCFNTASGGKGGVIIIHEGSLSITKSKVLHNFAHDSGGVLFGTELSVSIDRCEVVNNSAGAHSGVMYVKEALEVVISESNFTGNLHFSLGGVVHLRNFKTNMSMSIISSDFIKNDGGVLAVIQHFNVIYGMVTVKDSRFFSNSVADNGGVLAGKHINITIERCEFVGSTAGDHGGVMYIKHSHMRVSNSNFHNNSAALGGAMYKESTNVVATKCTFTHNVALKGAVLYTLDKTSLKLQDMDIIKNMAYSGVMYLIESTAILSGYQEFRENNGSLLAYNSVINITNYTKIISCVALKSESSVFQEGGALTAFQSEILLYGICSLVHNSAESGGAIHATESKVFVFGETMIDSNKATQTGGGVFLYQSELYCGSRSILKLLNNSALKKGGGIHAISSSIKVDFLEVFGDYSLSNVRAKYLGAIIHVVENEAKEGGGMCLEVNAKLYILRKGTAHETLKAPLLVESHAFTFTANSAEYGGAVYVADETNSGTCASISHKVHSISTECFIQILILSSESNVPVKEITINSYTLFHNNIAHVSGSTLFGGLLDRCTVSLFTKDYSTTKLNGTLSYFTHPNDTEYCSISSAPVRLCFCRNSQPDCGYQLPERNVKKGEKFIVSLVAVDHVNHTLSNITIRSSLFSKFGGLGVNQLNQTTRDNCSDLQFEVFSPNTSEELIMYADGPCKDASLSQKRIQIQFSPCTCPIGFQPKLTEVMRCACECDSKLDKYITECHPETKDVIRRGNFWVAYLNTSDHDDTPRDYLIYPHCPLDYCHSSGSVIKINFNTLNGGDAQCANDRSGLLCGMCKNGLSLSLGGSGCIACPGYWPALLVVTLTAAIIGGVVLVAIILVLNLTVAVGTLNGIIFYANVINANSSIFLPFKKPNFITVLLAWLNLGIGFDYCLFNGMDAYWKALLQLAYPVYLISLVVLIIILSEHYTRYARLIGKKNPVATLATLILLSYAKLLHLIIASFSFAILEYPDGSHKVVWLPDASVRYLSGKHIILFIIALLILLIGVIYTTLLFSWQWILRYQNKIVLQWLTYHKLCMFLEPYHAPYTFKHRYWTGLLLLIRAVLYVSTAANVSSDPGVNLLVVGIAVTGLLFIKGFFYRSLYRQWSLDLLEMSCYMNLSCFCFAQFFALAGNKDRRATAYVSGCFTLALLFIVLGYHVLNEFFMKVTIRSWKILTQSKQEPCLHDNGSTFSDTHKNQPTHSEIDGPMQDRQLPLSALLKCEKPQDKDMTEKCNSSSGIMSEPEAESKSLNNYYLVTSDYCN